MSADKNDDFSKSGKTSSIDKELRQLQNADLENKKIERSSTKANHANDS